MEEAAAPATGALLPGCSRSTVPPATGLRGMQGQRLGAFTVLVFVAPLLSAVTSGSIRPAPPFELP